MTHRLEHEYGVTTKIEKISARYPRWVTGPREKIEKAANESGRMLLFDSKGMPIIIFKDEWSLRWALKNDNDSGITFHEIAP
jgi:peptide chain release factor 3